LVMLLLRREGWAPAQRARNVCRNVCLFPGFGACGLINQHGTPLSATPPCFLCLLCIKHRTCRISAPATPIGAIRLQIPLDICRSSLVIDHRSHLHTLQTTGHTRVSRIICSGKPDNTRACSNGQIWLDADYSLAE
jgi:hypothetical protein